MWREQGVDLCESVKRITFSQRISCRLFTFTLILGPPPALPRSPGCGSAVPMCSLTSEAHALEPKASTRASRAVRIQIRITLLISCVACCPSKGGVPGCIKRRGQETGSGSLAPFFSALATFSPLVRWATVQMFLLSTLLTD